MPHPAILGALLFILWGAGTAAGQQLSGDVSSRLIAITSNYTGAELVLFGARQGEGDIVIVVRGPDQNDVVREKERIVGLWLNAASAVFESVPGFYAVAASRPLNEVAPPRLWRDLQIGTENLALPPREGMTEVLADRFRHALLRQRSRDQLFASQLLTVEFLGPTLFRSGIVLPAHAPDGGYTVSFYLIRKGEIVETRNTFFFINKTGFERTLVDFAFDKPATYGLIAVLIAIAAGWLASVIFRTN